MDNAPTSLLTHAQLLALGLTHQEVESCVRLGKLMRVRRGTYASPADLGPEEAHLRLINATLPVVDATNVLSHESAAILHGLPVSRSALGQVSMTRRTGGHGDSSPLLRVRQTALELDEVAEIDGIPVTSLARTTTDLARLLPFEWWVTVADAALRLGASPVTLGASSLNRHPRLKGLPRARSVLPFADPRAESPAESLSRVQIMRQGLPRPELQFDVYDRNGEWVARSDFAWPEYRLVGEVDGKFKYGELLQPGESPQDAIMREKRREEAIRRAGYWIVRWDWELVWRGNELGARIRGGMKIGSQLRAA